MPRARRDRCRPGTGTSGLINVVPGSNTTRAFGNCARMPSRAVVERDLLKQASLRGAAPVPGGVVIDDVPFYLWRHGCGPTAVGMVVGYYDGQGYDLIDGHAETQTDAVDQAIASGGDIGDPFPAGSEQHFEDYAMPIDSGTDDMLDDAYITAGRTAHADDCIADYMNTSKSTVSNRYGWSWSSDIGPSFFYYINQEDNSIEVTYEYYWHVAWDVVQTEIDNDRPMVFLVDTDGDNNTDHFVTVVGYRELNGVREYACHDTWDTAVRWEAFEYMALGQPWGIYNGVTFAVDGQTTDCASDSECDDGIACTVDTCDLTTGTCEFAPDDTLCDNGAFCDGQETCDADSGCLAGTPPCPAGDCDEATDQCTGVCDDVVYEAETMAHSTGGAVSEGWNIWSNGYAAFEHTFAGGAAELIVSASGTYAGGEWPNMTVTINGAQVYQTTVESDSWTDYTVAFDAPAGTAEVRVNFTNDYYNPPEDRNLLLDKVTVVCEQSGPFCGDGTVDPGEECDDGNTLPGDGCDPNCLIESTGELGAIVNVTNDWGSGYCVSVVITNDASQPTTAWTIIIDTLDASVNNFWNTGPISGTGEHTLAPVGWNAVIPAGGTDSSVGFCASRPNGSSSVPVVISADGVY